MTSHTTISPQEAADRLAIRELVDAYAHCADRRDAKGQLALFTEDTRFLVFYDLTSSEPSQELHGRESLAPVFDDLNQYVVTMHFNGQSTIQRAEHYLTRCGPGHRRELLPGPSPFGRRRRSAHANGGFHPLPR
jgi:hypothetical protein